MSDDILTDRRRCLQKLSLETIRCSSYKTFNKQNFVRELDQILIDLYQTDDSYSKLNEIFSEVVEKHAPTKSKTIRGNQACFTNKELNKVIMNKLRIKNI